MSLALTSSEVLSQSSARWFDSANACCQAAINPEEVSEVKWANIDHIKQQMELHPDHFTDWFKDELARYKYFSQEQQ